MSSEPLSAPGVTLSRAQAARIALAAQGFADPAPRGDLASPRHLRRVVERVRLVQIDSVNVVARSHYLPFFSRLGAYDRADLDRMRDGGPRSRDPRGLMESWAHEASLLSPQVWPFLGHRMRGERVEQAQGRLHRDHPGLLEAVLDVVTGQGPLTSREVEKHLPHAAGRGTEDWGWNWSAVKTSLEHLFRVGRVTSAGRTSSFERRYAATESVLPAAVMERAPWREGAPGDLECAVQLMRWSVQAHGVGTEQCLRDYFRLRPALAREGLQVLLASGEVAPVRIRGWDRPAYLDPAARRPRGVPGRALLSPFDSLIWERRRTEQLFGFRYRIEIYVPAAQRVHGYYVLPFLLDEQLVARVDLKTDRAGDRLLVRAVHLEPGAPPHTLPELEEELAALAAWLGVGDVVHA